MHGFYRWSVIIDGMCMGFINFLNFLLIYGWVLCTCAYGALYFAWILSIFVFFCLYICTGFINFLNLLLVCVGVLSFFLDNYLYMHGFYRFSSIFAVICMGFLCVCLSVCLSGIVFCMGFINFLNLLLVCAWVYNFPA